MAQVQVGDTTYTIPSVKGYKAVLASEILSGAMDQVRTVLDEVAQFRLHYGDSHKERITRDQAATRAVEARRLAADARALLADPPQMRALVQANNKEELDAAFDDEQREQLVERFLENGAANLQRRAEALDASAAASEQLLQNMGDDPHVEWPASPDPWEVYMFGFPKGLAIAKDEVLKLIALVVIDNKALRKAHHDGDVAQVHRELLELGEELLWEGELEELVALAALAGDVLEEKFEKSRSAVGKLHALYERATNPTQQTEEQTPEPTPGATDSSSSSPTSSTPSESPTGGATTRSASESPGTSSAPVGAA